MSAKLTIGRKVDDETSALAFADELLADATTYFLDNTMIEWTTGAPVNGVEIQTASVQGDSPMLKSGPKVQLQRAVIPVGGISADQLYGFLISKEGYTFLDPDANSDDFNRPLLGPFEWNTSKDATGKAQVEYASLPLPYPVSTRDYIILNAFDGASKTFLSTSCYSSQLKSGESPYEDDSTTAVASADGKIRMAFSGVYTVSEKDGQLLLEVAQYVDMNGWIPSVFSNFANTAWFKAFILRAQTKFPTKQE
jgi:hypothetical protein